MNPDIYRRLGRAFNDFDGPEGRFWDLVSPMRRMIEAGGMIRANGHTIEIEPPVRVIVEQVVINAVDCCASCKHGVIESSYYDSGYMDYNDYLCCRHEGRSHASSEVDPYSLCNLYERSSGL